MCNRGSVFIPCSLALALVCYGACGTDNAGSGRSTAPASLGSSSRAKNRPPSPPPPSSAQSTTYTSANGVFRVLVPAGWHAESEPGGRDVVYLSNTKDKSDPVRANIAVNLTLHPGKNNGPEHLKVHIDALKQARFAQAPQVTKTTLAGRPAIHYWGVIADGPIRPGVMVVQMHFTHIIQKDYCFWVGTSSLVHTYEKFQDVFDRVLKSITLLREPTNGLKERVTDAQP